MISTSHVPGRDWLLPVAGFAGYTLWLTAVPLKGPLLGALGDTSALLAFLVPHTVALVLLAWRRSWAGDSSQAAGIVLTAMLGAALPFVGSWARALLPGLGVAAALALLRAGALLKCAPNIGLAAAFGLVAGNITFLLLLQLPLPTWAMLSVVTTPLVLLLGGRPPRSSQGDNAYSAYLPFIGVFYLAKGLRYDMLHAQLSDYAAAGLPPGVDLLCYVAAVFGAWWLFTKDADYPLAAGVILGLAALLLSFMDSRVGLLLGMGTMHLSAGAVDIFVVAYLLSFSDHVRAFGFGAAVMCAGIAGGELIGAHLDSTDALLVMFGNTALTVAVLLLYFLGRKAARTHQEQPGTAEAPSVPAGQNTSPDARAECGIEVPAPLRARLSMQELAVLERVLAGCQYKRVALELGISESSVKTYMRRVYEKAEVPGRSALLEKLQPS